MNKFRYFSDTHGHLPDFKRESDLQEICIVAGDVGEFGNKGVKIVEDLKKICDRFKMCIFIPGNHEYYGTNIGTLESKLRNLMKDVDNFVLLQSGEYVDIDDVRVIGATLWSDTSSIVYDAGMQMNDYKYIRIGPHSEPWKYRLTPYYTTSIHKDHIKLINDALLEWDGDSIVVTHHAPCTVSLDKRYQYSVLNPAYATDIELSKWPNYWIHGHIHRACSYIHNGCNILCNPGGYATEYTDFEPLNNYFYL